MWLNRYTFGLGSWRKQVISRKRLLRVESGMWPILSLTLALAAEQAPKPADVGIRACSATHCWGKRIEHGAFRGLRFCVPFGMDFHRVAGFEGDIHDSITAQTHGETSQLLIFTANMTWGPVQTSPDSFGPSDAPTGTVRQWHSSEDEGRDFRMKRNGRSWRLLTFFKGYAEYEDVPLKAAANFDRILDSLCCQPLPPSNGRDKRR